MECAPSVSEQGMVSSSSSISFIVAVHYTHTHKYMLCVLDCIHFHPPCCPLQNYQNIPHLVAIQIPPPPLPVITLGNVILSELAYPRSTGRVFIVPHEGWLEDSSEKYHFCSNFCGQFWLVSHNNTK